MVGRLQDDWGRGFFFLILGGSGVVGGLGGLGDFLSFSFLSLFLLKGGVVQIWEEVWVILITVSFRGGVCWFVGRKVSYVFDITKQHNNSFLIKQKVPMLTIP